MTSHLRVTIDDIDLVLTEDTSISIELKNPYLNDGIDTYTYSFDVPLDGNRELLGDLDNPDSDRRLTSIEGHPMAIYIDGVLFAHGKVATIEEQTIVDKVSISMTSNKKQLKDMVADMQLRDLSFPESDKPDLQIGEKIGNILVNRTSTSSYGSMAVFRKLGNVYVNLILFDAVNHLPTTGNGYVQPQALGFSAPKEYEIVNGEPVVRKDFINTSVPFKENITHPDGTTRRALYHNARICYMHHALDTEGKSSEYVEYDNKKYGPYYMLEADRPQSGICFYLMYVLEVLFKNLEIHYDDAPIAAIEDMKRLSFFTTACKYDIDDPGKGVRSFGYETDFDSANQWLSARNIKGRLSKGYKRNSENESEDIVNILFYPNYYVGGDRHGREWKDVGSLGKSIVYVNLNETPVTRPVSEDGEYLFHFVMEDGSTVDYEMLCWGVGVNYVDDDTYSYSSEVVRMYANADNLPDMSVTDFLDSLWGSFGLRFHYDSETNEVTPYFIRDMLRNDRVHSIYGSDISVHKISEKITGVSIRYSAESDFNEQLTNLRKGVTDYDTRYDYLVDHTPVKDIETRKRYSEVAHGTMSAGDYTLYVDTVTGNTYRIKINKDELSAGNISGLQPSLFQVAQFKGILERSEEYKDASDNDLLSSDFSDYVHEITSSFEPLVQNDLYANKAKQTQLLAPFTDEEMWNEQADMDVIQNPVDSNRAYVHYVQEEIDTEERYDVSGTDDGNSPLQSIDWGSSICIMRGGGTNATTHIYDRGYDFFGNEKWRMVSGDYCMDYDTITNYAEQYDYNGGTVGGIGIEEGRFSLAIRAYHLHPETGIMMCSPEFARRGLADTFFSEYIYFLLHRKKLFIETMCEIEHIIDMQWRDKYAIAGHTGWIDQLSVKVSVQKGIEKVEFTMFEL